MRNIIFVLLAILMIVAIILIEKKDKVLAEDGAYHFPGLAPGRLAFILSVLILMTVAISCNRPKQTQIDDSTYVYPGATPYFLALSNDGGEIYVAVSEGIAVIDKESMQILDIHPFQYSIYDMVLDTNGDYIYLVYNPPEANGTGKLAKMNISDGNFSVIDLSPANVYCVAIDDAGEYLYVSGGTWPEFGGGWSLGEHSLHLGTGRLFEIRLSDFTLVRSANLSVALESGLSYQGGKLVVMTPLITTREYYGIEGSTYASTCLIINVEDLSIEKTIGVPYGEDENTSFAISGDTYVMTGFRSDGEDGVGLGLINVQTGEVEQWYITDPNPFPYPNPEAGGDAMAEDTVNNILYSTLWTRKADGKTHFRVAVIDLNTNAYSEWLLEPFRLYSDILYDPEGEKIYLCAPFDDAIVVLDPPEIVHTLVPPVACFEYNPQSGPSPLTVTIDNCSYDEDGEIVRIDCDWDADGEIDEVMEGNPAVLVHTFNEPGTNDFVLTVVDNDDLETAWTGTVDVE